MSKVWMLLLASAAFAAPALAQTVEDESPDQRAYEGRMDAQVRSWIHDGNHEATDDERKFVREHWERAAKLWRIRKLAAAARDNASVARADSLLARADRILEEHIRRFREHAPIMTAPPPEVEVTQAPPPPPAEAQPPSPGPGEVWLPGFWQWNGARHVWSPGRWATPPQAGMTWEPAKWENRGGRWAFNEGRWRLAAQPPANVVYEPPPAPEADAPTAPPPPVVEVRPSAPPNAVWIPGYWHWNGKRHVWVGGRWSAPKAGMRWEPDHWEHRGNQWHMVRGRWMR